MISNFFDFVQFWVMYGTGGLPLLLRFCQVFHHHFFETKCNEFSSVFAEIQCLLYGMLKNSTTYSYKKSRVFFDDCLSKLVQGFFTNCIKDFYKKMSKYSSGNFFRNFRLEFYQSFFQVFFEDYSTILFPEDFLMPIGIYP